MLETLKRLRYYDLAIPVALLLAIPLDILLDLHNGDDFFLKDDLSASVLNALNKRDTLNEVILDINAEATTLSALTYLARTVDFHANNKTFLGQPEGFKEADNQIELQNDSYCYRGTYTGVALGAIFTVVLFFFLLNSIGWSLDFSLIETMGSLTAIKDGGGIGSRAGRLFDRKASKKTLNRNYELSIIAAFMLAFVIVAFLIMAAVMSATPLAPLAVMLLALNCLNIIAAVTSVSHYIGMSCDLFTDSKTLLNLGAWLLGQIICHDFNFSTPTTTTFWQRCNNERLLTFIGVVIGLSLGIALVTLGVAMPAFIPAAFVALTFIPGGLAAVLQAAFTIVLTAGLIASIACRIGRMLDRFWFEPDAQSKPQPWTVLHGLRNFFWGKPLPYGLLGTSDYADDERENNSSSNSDANQEEEKSIVVRQGTGPNQQADTLCATVKNRPIAACEPAQKYTLATATAKTLPEAVYSRAQKHTLFTVQRPTILPSSKQVAQQSTCARTIDFNVVSHDLNLGYMPTITSALAAPSA